MPKFIGLQAGHQNAKDNCVPALRPGTGAPGEQEFTIRTRDKLSQILNSKKNADGSKAFTVQLDDATANCQTNTTGKNFDLYLAIHYEADVHRDAQGKSMDGGMICPPDPSIDVVYNESNRISKAIESEYFNHAGITNRPQWISNNMRFYYMWSSLSASTPCVILECGVGQNPHDKVILADADRVANAIARGICKAFNVPFDAPTPTPTPPPATNYEAKYNQEVKDHNVTKGLLKASEDREKKANDRIKDIKDHTAAA